MLFNSTALAETFTMQMRLPAECRKRSLGIDYCSITVDNQFHFRSNAPRDNSIHAVLPQVSRTKLQDFCGYRGITTVPITM